MKRVPDPSHGRKFNAAHPPKEDKEMVSVSETHEEHLRVCYPSTGPEIDQLKAASVPASFKTKPGHITGLQLVQLGVPGLCPRCGEWADRPNPKCKTHAEEVPKNSGGG